MEIQDLIKKLQFYFPGKYITINCEFCSHSTGKEISVEWDLYVADLPKIQRTFKTFDGLKRYVDFLIQELDHQKYASAEKIMSDAVAAAEEQLKEELIDGR